MARRGVFHVVAAKDHALRWEFPLCGALGIDLTAFGDRCARDARDEHDGQRDAENLCEVPSVGILTS